MEGAGGKEGVSEARGSVGDLSAGSFDTPTPGAGDVCTPCAFPGLHAAGPSVSTVSLQDIMTKLTSMHVDMDSKFSVVQRQYTELRTELSSLKQDMVTQANFTRLEARVFDLENQQLQSDTPEMNFLLQQLDRLDPARKSLSVVGFKNSTARSRTTIIEEFIRTNFPSEQGHVYIEHISKGACS